MTREVKLALGALALLILPYFLGLGHPDLWDANETLYAEPPREAVETGQWLVPTMNYEPWFVKPPGVTWITIPFYLGFGSNEFAGRLPMALFAALTIWFTFLMGRRLGGLRAALLSAAFLATTAKFFMFSRQFAGDVFLTAVLIAAGWGYLRWYDTDGERRGGLWFAAAICGAGALLKGPVSLLLPVVFVPLHLWLSRRGDLLRRLKPAGPALLALALAAPWFVFMSVRFGRDFVSVYFIEHHFARAFSEMFGGGRGPLYYPIAWLGDALPWSLAFPGALFVTLRDGKRDSLRRDPRFFPLLWCAVVLVFFTLSTGKRSVYMLPLYPAVALILGITVDRLVSKNPGWRSARFMVAPVLAAVVLMIPIAIWLFFVFPEFRPMGIPAVALLVAWAVGLVLSFRRRSVLFALGTSFGVLLVLGAWVALNLDDLQPYRPAREFAERIAVEAQPGDAFGRYGVGLQSLTFYGERPFFSLRDPESLRETCLDASRTWVVLPATDISALTEDSGLATEIVDEGIYLQVSLPALLGKKDAKRRLLLVRVTPQETGPRIPPEK